MITIPMKVAATVTEIPVSVASNQASIAVGLGASYSMAGYDPYEGSYTVTPSQSVQILETNGKVMRNNVTIEPIPQNYGLVTWNGSVLTIS